MIFFFVCVCVIYSILFKRKTYLKFEHVTKTVSKEPALLFPWLCWTLLLKCQQTSSTSFLTGGYEALEFLTAKVGNQARYL